MEELLRTIVEANKATVVLLAEQQRAIVGMSTTLAKIIEALDRIIDRLQKLEAAASTGSPSDRDAS